MSTLPTTLPPSWTERRLLPASDSIRQRADEILALTPDDHHSAVIAVQGDLMGVRLAAMARGQAAGGEWTFVTWAGYRWFDKTPDGGVELRWSI